MPQPLKRWIDGIQFSSEAISKRPLIASGIAKVAAAWSQVDVELGILLAIILRTEASTGIAMYLALSGSPAQRSTISAAAEHAQLPLELLDRLGTVLNSVRTRGRERNNVVHALWSVHPEKEHLLINCPPENIVRAIADSAIRMNPQSDPFHTIFNTFSERPSQKFIEALRTYKEQDFNDIVERISDLREQVDSFQREVGSYLDSTRQSAAAPAPEPPNAETEPPLEDRQNAQKGPV